MQRDRSPLRSPVRSPSASAVRRNIYSPTSGPVRSPSTSAVRRNIYSPTSGTEVIDLIGYVSLIGSLRKGQTGNQYVNVIFKQGEDKTITIKVMHPVGNTLLSLKDEPVKLYKLSRKGDTTFFNHKYGSKCDKLEYELPFHSRLLFTPIDEVSEQLTTTNLHGSIFWIDEKIQTTPNNKEYKQAVLKDETGEIRLTVWGVYLMEELKEGQWYDISDVNIKNYYGIKLETSPVTVTSLIMGKKKLNKPNIQEYVDIQTSNSQGNNERIENPTILSVSVTEEFYCMFCKEVVKKEMNNMFVKCDNEKCNRRFLANKCLPVQHGVLDIEVLQKPLSLQFTVDAIANLINPQDDTNKIEEKLLVLEDIAVTYKKNGNLVGIEMLKMEDEGNAEEVNDEVTTGNVFITQN